MAIPKETLESLLAEAFPDATLIKVVDLAGDSDHYQAEICSASFEGLSRIKQHQKVYAALGEMVGGKLHALSLITRSA
jgi:stress-induced morphogen